MLVHVRRRRRDEALASGAYTLVTLFSVTLILLVGGVGYAMLDEEKS